MLSVAQELKSAIKGVGVGVFLFLIAFPLLIWNEGRAVHRAQDLEEGGAAVATVAAGTIDPANQGALVHVSEVASTIENVSDSLFHVGSTALRLRRSVEMYQWTEQEEETTQSKAGGGQETVTTYVYAAVWSSEAIDSSDFHDATHGNVPFPVEDNEWRAQQVTLGAFQLSAALVDQIDNFEPVPPDGSGASRVRIGNRPTSAAGDYYYVGENPAASVVGDLRVRFEASRPTAVSVVGAQSGAGFGVWTSPRGGEIAPRLVVGTLSGEQMFDHLEGENDNLSWGLRFLGWLLLFLGLTLIFRPMVALAERIPVVGKVVSAGAFVAAIVIASPLAMLTIALGWITYNPIIGGALIALTAGLIVGGVWLTKKANERRSQRDTKDSQLTLEAHPEPEPPGL